MKNGHLFYWPLWWGLGLLGLALCTSSFLIPLSAWGGFASPAKSASSLFPVGLVACLAIPLPRPKQLHWLPLLWRAIGVFTLIATTLLFLVPLPENNAALTIPYIDKLVHLLLHSLLAAYFAALYRPKWSFLFFLFYAVCIEAAQLFVEHRDWETSDLVANLLGVHLGHFLLSQHLRRGIRRIEQLLGHCHS